MTTDSARIAFRVAASPSIGGGHVVRSVSLANAKTMAQRGGVIGIWPSKFNFNDPRAYVEALGEAVAMVGEDHVAFGTDMEGLAPAQTMMNNYTGMREIVNPRPVPLLALPPAAVPRTKGSNTWISSASDMPGPVSSISKRAISRE